TPTCPPTYSHAIPCAHDSAASTSGPHRSLFITSFFSLVIQPFFCQPWTHLVMPLITYDESVCTTTGKLARDAASLTALSAAVSSMRLLVVRSSRPPSSVTLSSVATIAPHPPGPGLPLLAPSQKIKISSMS